MTGRIFDIRRFSTHDGDGIRTTVFLKGCPLSCVWCQNPEGISSEARPIYFENRCMKCKSCVIYSKVGGITVEDDNIKLHSEEKEDWEKIIGECPTGAIAMDSREYTVDEVMQEVIKDCAFYDHGDGGVTLSGGEPLFQGKFTIEILKACKKEGIHTSIETSLYVEADVLKEATKYLDQIFVDYKLADEKHHEKYVGVTNKTIKKNLKWLLESEYKNKVIVRTPLIPTMTATKANIIAIAREISRYYDKVKYELLNYNPLAESKYHLINKEFCFKENPKMYSNDVMNEFSQWAKNGGIENVIIES